MDSFNIDDTLLESSVMSESQSMDESGFRYDFSVQFIEILKASGMNEDLLPNCNEINEEIKSIPGSEEFIEWFNNAITLSNVVSEEELKISKELKDVPIEEINTFLEQTLGDKRDKTPVTEEIIDQLLLEEEMCRTQLKVTQCTKELLKSKLNSQAEQKKSLLLSTNQIKRELRKELNLATDFYQNSKTNCEKLLENFNIFKNIEVGNADPVLNLMANMDLSKFYELNKEVIKEFKEALSHYESFTDDDELSICSAISVNINKNQGVRSKEREEANDLLLRYLNSKIKSEEKKVEFIGIFSLLARQSRSCNRTVSFLYETEVKRTTVVLNLIEKLLSSLNAILNIEIPSSKFYSKNNDELMLSNNLQKWNEILTGSNDFVTIKEFTESLKDFNQKLIDSEFKMNEFIRKLNRSLAESINTIKDSLVKINKEIEGSIEVSSTKRLCSYIEMMYEASEQLKELKTESEKEKSSLCETILLKGLTDHQDLINKIEELERKVKLLESASQG